VPVRARSGAQVDYSIELEIRVWGGIIQQTPRRLPRTLFGWELYRAGEKHSGPLPASFSTSGNLRLVFAFDADEPLVITGSRLTLRLLKHPLRPAPNSRGMLRTVSRRVRRKLRP